MLTADLVRVTVRDGRVKPAWVDPEKADLVERAETLIALWAGAMGGRRAELDEALDDLVAEDPRVQLMRGLAKLLDDRARWESPVPIDPIVLRERVFEASAAAHPIAVDDAPAGRRSRDSVLAEVAAGLGVTVADVEAGLYADLRSEQRMLAWEPIEALDLLHRYNLALAQGVLLRATELRVEVAAERAGELRQLLTALKFHQLMHRAERSGAGWRLVVDGPMSVLRNPGRYGVQMAMLLPTLLLLPGWRLEADVRWDERGMVRFELDASEGLRTFARARGTWISREERLLEERINASSSGWRAERDPEIVELQGQDVLVPDLVLRHADGRTALVEVVGYWRRAWLERRLELLVRHGPPNLVLCVSRKLAADETVWEGFPGMVVPFAEVINLGRVIEAAERVGAVGTPAPGSASGASSPGRGRSGGAARDGAGTDESGPGGAGGGRQRQRSSSSAQRKRA